MARINYKNTPLSQALVDKNYDFFYQLLAKNPDVTEGDNIALRVASLECDFAINKALIDRGADIHINNNEIIVNATAAGNIDLVKHLVSLGIDCQSIMSDEEPGGLVLVASSNGHLELLQYLVDIGCDYHLWEDSAFRYACFHERYDCAEYLLSLDTMSFHTENDIVMQHVCSGNKIELFQWLTERADFDLTPYFTNLIFKGYEELFDIFLEKSVTMPDIYSAVKNAIQHDRETMLEKLKTHYPQEIEDLHKDKEKFSKLNIVLCHYFNLDFNNYLKYEPFLKEIKFEIPKNLNFVPLQTNINKLRQKEHLDNVLESKSVNSKRHKI